MAGETVEGIMAGWVLAGHSPELGQKASPSESKVSMEELIEEKEQEEERPEHASAIVPTIAPGC